MSKLEEIEAATELLAPNEKQQLLVFLAARMRAQSSPFPEPRKFSSEQIAGWIAEDEADMRRFEQGR